MNVFVMKNRYLATAIIGLGLVGFVGAASAQYRDYSDERSRDYLSYPERNLRSEINHVNRMYAHVRWQLRRYSAGPHLWREYRHISREIDRVNYEYNRGSFDRYRLQRDIEHVHSELHQIELELRVRGSDYYRWH